MYINKSDNTHFGWFDKTHRFAIGKVIKELPDLQKYEEILKEFVVRPDYNELGYWGNWHFYYPKTEGSFLDINRQNNAFVRYRLHVEKMLEAISEEDRMYKVMKHAGKALHFLQDMTQPHHTQEGFFFNKVLNVNTHLGFEKLVNEMRKPFLKGHIIAPPISQSFEDIFMGNVNFSSKIGIPTDANRTNDWEHTGKEGLKQAVDSTWAFLSKVNDMLKAKDML